MYSTKMLEYGNQNRRRQAEITFPTLGKRPIRSRRDFKGGEEVSQGERGCEVILEEATFHLTADRKYKVEAVMLGNRETKLYVGRD